MMKLFAGLIVLAALAVGVAMVVGGRVPLADRTPMTPIQVASPADSFVVHDAPAAASPPVTAPPPTPAAPDPAPGGLEAAIERLRAAKTDTGATPPPAAPADAPAPALTPTPATADPLLAGPNPAPSILAGPPITPPPPPQTWTVVTSQGVRWRGSRDSLAIDMGGGRVATVFVDPAFQSLPLEAASARVDFLKETILENFPRSATQFRFARDGSVSMVR
jgi:hypothetical protein